MKNTLLSFGLFLVTATLGMAHEEHKHDDHKHEAEVGPTGGRILHKIEPHAEFFVNKDKKVEIRFLDDNNKVIAPSGQIVKVTTGTRKNPAELTFVKDGNKLISEQVLPEGNNNPTVVQIRPSEGAKAVTEKFNLKFDKCPHTGHPEYALGDHDHDHKH